MEQSLQKPTLAKRIFIGIDLLVVALVLLLMPKWLWVLLPLYLYLVYFRVNLSLMMLLGEKKTLIGSLVMAVVAIGMIMDTNYLFGGMGWYYYGISQTLIRYTEHEVIAAIIWVILFGWFFITPLVYSMGQLLSKPENDMAKWYDIFALTYLKRTPWRGQVVDLFLLSLLFVVAELIGLWGQTTLGSIWCIPLSMMGLWLLVRLFRLNRRAGRHQLWIIGGYILLLTALWASQYLYGERRIVLLGCYILGFLLSYYTVARSTSGSTIARVIQAGVLSLVTLLALPILTLGYNLFSAMDEVRIGGCSTTATVDDCPQWLEGRLPMAVDDSHGVAFYIQRGVYYIQDKEGNIGLRDRRGVVIPTDFEAIEICMLPYFKVKREGLWGIYDLSGDYMYRRYYWVEEGTKSGLLIPCQYTDDH